MNAPVTEARKTVEHQLRNRDANLEEALRWFDRQLGKANAEKLVRLELRFPSRSAKPIDKPTAQKRILALSESKGVVGIAISVRPHELPLDNDMGLVTVRAIYAVADATQADSRPTVGWLTRLKNLILGSDDVDAEDANASVDLPMQHALAAVLESLDKAAKLFAGAQKGKPVGSVVVNINAPELHRVLAPKMPPVDAENATLWIAREIQTRGLQAVPEMALYYRFQEPLSDSTQLVSDGALHIVLLPPGDPARPKPTQAPDNIGQDTPLPQPDGETAMPLPEPVNAFVGPTVSLRLLGTWQAGALVPLEEPFACNLGAVPAQFSRSTLELVGFTKRPDAPLARAASNSTPLGFSSDGQGGIKLHAAFRPGGNLPMYFFAEDLSPCTGEHPLAKPMRLVVNGPTPLQDGLFPLVIEVSTVE